MLLSCSAESCMAVTVESSFLAANVLVMPAISRVKNAWTLHPARGRSTMV